MEAKPFSEITMATGDAGSKSPIKSSPGAHNSGLTLSPIKDNTDMADKACKSTDTDATRQAVMQHVQHLMDNLEKKRDADKQMIEEFRCRMHSMVDQMSQKVEDCILKTHDTTNRELKRKLHYLNEVLGHVCCLEKEFGQAKNVVGHIYKDILT